MKPFPVNKFLPVALLTAVLLMLLLPVWQTAAKFDVPEAVAYTFTVNHTEDIDDNLNNGFCEDFLGRCTLRAAIQEANAQPGLDTILIEPGTYLLTQTGASEDNAATGDLDITDDVIIQASGAGVYIDGNQIDRVFHIPSASVSVQIEGIVIRNGQAPDTGIRDGGGILNWGALTLQNVTVTGNEAGPGSNGGVGGGVGGGIYTLGPLVLNNTSVVSNQSGDGADGSSPRGGGYGGGVYAWGYPVTVTHSTIAYNSTGRGGDGTGGASGDRSGEGGGLYLGDDTTVSITDSAIHHNSTGAGGSGDNIGGASGNDGGLHFRGQSLLLTRVAVYDNSTGSGGTGVSNDGSGGGCAGVGVWYARGVVSIEQSTISGNQTGNGRYGGLGGGLCYIDPVSDDLTLTNSTISGNTAAAGTTAGGNGGGWYISSGTTNILDSTISNNHAYGNGGGVYIVGGTTNVRNIILANNTTAGTGPDCNGMLTSQGYNLVENTTVCAINGDTIGNLTGQDPKLGMLQDNGGATQTHSLLSGSPAIDTGHPTLCPATDQRGQTRPYAYTGVARCDMGAFEIQGQESSTVSSLPEGTAVIFGSTLVSMTRQVSSTDPLTTTVTKSNEPPGGDAPDSGEMAVTWAISATVDTGLGVDTSFCYNDDELGSLTEANLAAYRYDGTDWQSMGGVVDAVENCVLVEGVSAFSDWTLATEPPTMPVALTGDINGAVRYVGSHPDAVNIEMGLHPAVGNPPMYTQNIAVPGGAYSFTAVNNGSYYVSAFINLDGSGGAPDPYDLVNWYDADGDGTPDPIVVNNDVTNGIDLFVADQYLGPSPGWEGSPQGNLEIYTVGDVNGDGYDDILVGVADADAAYLWYGSTAGLGLDGTIANADWLAQGNANTDFGAAVAPAGDVNGDGFDDILIGAPRTNSDAGAVYIWFGSVSGLGAAGTVANADWVATSSQTGAELGTAVFTAGDVNNDTYDDILIGAAGFSAGESEEGAALLYLGSSGGLGDPGTLANADWQAVSNRAGARLGTAVFTAGDVNNDAYDDILIGAPGYSNGETNEGLVLVYRGSASGLGDNGTPANADWRAESNSADTAWGTTITPAGDVNGDGYDDVVISQPPLYGWYGSSSGLGDDGTLGNADWFVDSWSEKTVSAVGDTNADGYDELWVGQPYVDYTGQDAGSVGLFGGGNSGLSDDYVWWAGGPDVDARWGLQVAPAGDVNGDGAADVMAVQEYPAKVLVWLGGAPLSSPSTANDGPTILNAPTTLTAAFTAGTLPQFAWDFGDGNTGSGTPVNHTYGATGMYTAVVTLSNPVSTYTATTNVTVYEEAIVGLTVIADSPTTLGETTILTATVSAGSNVVYSWDFGDETAVVTGQVVTHTYAATGVYTATVTAENQTSMLSATTTAAVVKDAMFYIYLPTIIKP